MRIFPFSQFWEKGQGMRAGNIPSPIPSPFLSQFWARKGSKAVHLSLLPVLGEGAGDEGGKHPLTHPRPFLS